MDYLHDLSWEEAETVGREQGLKIRRWNVVDRWLIWAPLWKWEFISGPDAGVIRLVKAHEFTRADFVATDYTTMRPDQYSCPVNPLPPPVPEEPSGPVRFVMFDSRPFGLPPWVPGEIRVYPDRFLPDGTIVKGGARRYYSSEEIQAARAAFAPGARLLETFLWNRLSVPVRMLVQSRVLYFTAPLTVQRAPLHIGDAVFENTVIDFQRNMEAGEKIPVWLTMPQSRIIEPGQPGSLAPIILQYALVLTAFPE